MFISSILNCCKQPFKKACNATQRCHHQTINLMAWQNGALAFHCRTIKALMFFYFIHKDASSNLFWEVCFKRLNKSFKLQQCSAFSGSLLVLCEENGPLKAKRAATVKTVWNVTLIAIYFLARGFQLFKSVLAARLDFQQSVHCLSCKILLLQCNKCSVYAQNSFSVQQIEYMSHKSSILFGADAQFGSYIFSISLKRTHRWSWILLGWVQQWKVWYLEYVHLCQKCLKHS